MTEHQWEENQPRHAAPEPETPPPSPAEPAPCGGSFQCPYGQPQPAPNRGSRTLIAILVGIAAAFVIGFGGYAVFLSIQQNLGGGEQSHQGAGYSSEAALPGPASGGTENPVGTGTDPNFAGLKIAAAGKETLSPKELYRKLAPSVAAVSLVDADGEPYTASAVALTKDGYLLTTAHAVGYSREGNISVTFQGGKPRKALVVGYDQSADVAVLKVGEKNLTPAVLGGTGSVAPGDWVYAVAGGEDGGDCVLTRGILSARARSLSYDGVSGVTYLQSDASVGLGGSGGALVNGAGQVVGLTISSDYLETYGSESYAIPMEQVRAAVEDIIRSGYVSGRVRLGITGSGLTRQEAENYGVPRGVVIVSIQADSAFDGTEAKEGDIITELDGTTVTGMDDVAPVLQNHKAGDRIEVKLYRVEESGKDRELTVEVTLRDDAGQTQQ